jgi:hypothetical protein
MDTVKLIKVKDAVSLHRDTESGAIVNTSYADYDKYITSREIAISERVRVDRLESDVADIKGMLQQLMSKLS